MVFLCEIIAIAVLVHWTYINDQPGPDSGSKGLLRMIEKQSKRVVASGKRAPKWLSTGRGESEERTVSRDDRSFGGPEPDWKRRRTLRR